MGQNDGTTVGVWFSDSNNLLESIDDRVNWRYGSRSEWLRNAAEMRLTVDNAFEETGGKSFESEQDKRAYVRQLILDDSRE